MIVGKIELGYDEAELSNNETRLHFLLFFIPENLSQIITLQPALKFNGGGHINHSLFWEVLSPNGGGEPKGDLMEIIRRDFGLFENMKNELINRTVAIQGSGWGWLGYNPATGRLRINTTANQDPLEPTTGKIQVICEINTCTICVAALDTAQMP